MRAMVLAAGLGTRLRPLTQRRPKCLMPVMNHPLLGWWLNRLAAWGVQAAVVNTHHLAEQVRAFLGDLAMPGLAIHESHEPVILGTGGGLVQARPRLGEAPFLLVNSDVMAAAALPPLGEHLREHGCLAVLGLTDAPRFNTVAVDQGGAVLGFRGDPGLPSSARWLTYTGLAAIHPRLLDHLPATGFSSLVDGLSAAIEAGEKIAGVALEGFWDDLGTPQALLDLHRALVAAPPAGLADLAPPGPLVLAPGAVIEPGARAEGLCVLGRGCHIQAGAWVRDSLLLPGARVVFGARVRDAVLGDGFVAQGEITGGAHA